MMLLCRTRGRREAREASLGRAEVLIVMPTCSTAIGLPLIVWVATIPCTIAVRLLVRLVRRHVHV
jgi:hypothetical protein